MCLHLPGSLQAAEGLRLGAPVGYFPGEVVHRGRPCWLSQPLGSSVRPPQGSGEESEASH